MPTKINLKKKPKAYTCHAMRCRVKDSLYTVEDPENLGPGQTTLCDRHLKAYQAEPAEPTGTEVAAPPTSEPAPAVGQTSVIPTQESILATVEPIRLEAAGMHTALANLTIVDQGGLDAAAPVLAWVKGKLKALEAQRTSVTKPLLDLKKTIDSWFVPGKSQLSELERHIKAAMEGYVTSQEQARLAALHAGQHTEALAVEQPVMPQGVSTRTVWQFEITDVDSIPREYMVPDGAKISAHVQQNKAQSSIPGVRAFPKTGISSKASS